MNLPNKLTTFRMCCVPLFVVVFFVDVIPFNYLISLIIFAAASVTDWLDGYIARKENLVTDYGKFMDPLADKLLVCSAMICLAGDHLYKWMVIVIICRELFISGFRTLAANKGVVLAAGWWGKVKTFTQMFMIIVLLLYKQFPFAVLGLIGTILAWASVILAVGSMVEYILKNKEFLADM